MDCMLTGIPSCLRITCQRSVKSPRRASLWLSWTSAWLCLSTGNLQASSWNTLFYTQPPVSVFSHSLEAGQEASILPSELHYFTFLWLGILSCFWHNSWVTESGLNPWFTPTALTVILLSYTKQCACVHFPSTRMFHSYILEWVLF